MRQLLRPYRLACIEPLPGTTAESRRHAAERAGLNVSLLDPTAVEVDLRTDSATSSWLTGQLAALQTSQRAPENPRSRDALVDEIRCLTGMRHVVMFAQGRSAEAALVDSLQLDQKQCAANTLFPSTRFHLERRGCEVVECPSPGLFDPLSDEPFKADPDPARVSEVLAKGSSRSIVWLELAANGSFGQPVSLEGRDRLRLLARQRSAPLYLDATRCLENAVLLQQRERRAAGMPIRAIVHELCRGAHAISASCLKSFHAEAGGFVATDDPDLACRLEDAAVARGDGLAGAACEVLRQGLNFACSDAVATDRARQAALLHRWMRRSGLPVFRPEAAHAVFLDARRFLPHLPADCFPAKALALALYLESGIRVDEHFVPESLRSRGLVVVRIALPARRYFDDQIRWVADQLATLHERSADVPGLEPLPWEPGLAGSLRRRFSIAAEVRT